MTERLLEANEAAALLSVPKSWVLEQARQGAIPHVRLGRYVRFDEAELRAWVDSLRTGGGPTYRRHHPTTRGDR